MAVSELESKLGSEVSRFSEAQWRGSARPASSINDPSTSVVE